MTLRDVLLAFAAVGLLVVTSCASLAKSPGAPPSRQMPVGPEPATVDEAQADIDRWGAQLGLAATQPATAASGGAPAEPTSQPPAAPLAPQSSPTSAGTGSTKSVEAETSTAECVMPCRAIASMRRSVTALCRLAGEEDVRCVAARRTLDEGERRVARCGC